MCVTATITHTTCPCITTKHAICLPHQDYTRKQINQAPCPFLITRTIEIEGPCGNDDINSPMAGMQYDGYACEERCGTVWMFEGHVRGDWTFMEPLKSGRRSEGGKENWGWVWDLNEKGEGRRPWCVGKGKWYFVEGKGGEEGHECGIGRGFGGAWRHVVDERFGDSTGMGMRGREVGRVEVEEQTMDGKVVKRQDTPMPEDSPSPNIKAEPSSPDLRALNQLQNIIELSREMEGFNLIPLPGDEFKLDTSVKKMCPTHGVEIKGESDVSIFEDPSASGPAYKKTRCK